MGVFKAYDIRGKWGEGIDEEMAYKVGRAYGRYHGGDSYIVGYDARLYSAKLYGSLVRGLVDEGKIVTGIGLCSTPALHYLQVKGNFHGGVMITASHNPPEYHGFKIFDNKGGSISYDKGLNKIEEIVNSIDNDKPSAVGKFQELDKMNEYILFLSRIAGEEKFNLKVVIDPANGSAGRVFDLLTKQLRINAVIINKYPDGNFPVHGPNPLEAESRKMISAKVKELGADLGALLDGDGDRIIFIDENGEAIPNYFVSALIAEEFISENPGAAIVYDLISSKVLPERISELGGKPVESKVGYTFLYDNMVESGALFGTETSGHVYFKVSDSFYTESAAYALIVLLKLLQKKGQKLSTLIAPMKLKYFQAKEINVEVENKTDAMLKAEAHFSNCKITKLDGITIEGEGFWCNIRPSNTEPVLRLRLEADNQEIADAKVDEIMKLISG